MDPPASAASSDEAPQESPAVGQRATGFAPSRIEAISDGILAITITLLVLEIGRPEVGHGTLPTALRQQWPAYLAFAVSFAYIGVIWLNHQALFAQVRQVDLGLSLINLGILATTALLPFPTSLVAMAMQHGAPVDQQAAVVLYALAAALMSAAWLPVFPYLQRHPALLRDPAQAPMLGHQWPRPWVGIASYLLAALVGYLRQPLLAIALFAWMIGYHAITSEGLGANRLARFMGGPWWWRRRDG